MLESSFDRTRASAGVAAGVLAACLVVTTSAEAADTWSDVSNVAIVGERHIVPDAYRTVDADLVELRATLAAAPLEVIGQWDDMMEISLPMPDGTSARFAIAESPVMADGLAARYPEIRTYFGRGLDDKTATARLDLVPSGFHAMILGTSGTILIDPYQTNDNETHIVYRKSDLNRDTAWTCTLDATEDQIRAANASIGSASFIENGDELRTYRAAIAATGEYTSFHGGTVPAGLAAIVTALNRVTGIYERDISVRMELIANNDDVVYTNSSTDPFTNNDGFAMLGQNQANMTSVIGSANYDIGHVFSTGGGGVASLGVVCNSSLKARGVTGLPTPTGDVFYVDYVAHEMGHQFNATHSFNGTSGACGGGNRTATTAYEPGSGSTIMGYAGICGAHNIQNFSDDYFNSRSQDIIVVFTNGTSCPVVTATGNTAPVVVADQAVSQVPLDTPFTLTGSGSDPDGDDITYCWEEFDLGPGGHPDFPSGTAPIFRSYQPVDGPSRTFPKWTDIINDVHTRGEILPSYDRVMRFRLIVRDNLGGTNHDQIVMNADGDSGPFLVTVPDGGETWSTTVDHLVEWDVANTDNATVNCQIVDITLSTDGGFTYPHTLATGVPNDGSELITLPLVVSTTARIMVAAADNVFFDISTDDFEITSTVAVGDPSTVTGPNLLANRPNPTASVTQIAFEVTEGSQATLRVFDSAGRVVATLTDGFVSAGSHSVTWDGRDLAGRSVSPGVYFYRLEVGDVHLQRKMIVAR